MTPLSRTSRFHVDQFEAQVPIRLLVNLLEAHRLLVVDPAHLGRRDKSEIANEEDVLLVDRFSLDAVQFVSQKWRNRESEIPGQRRRAHRAPVMKLNTFRLMRRTNLALLLERCHRIEKRRMHPWLFCAALERGRDHIRRRLFDHAESVELKLTQNRRLPGARGACKNVPFHVNFHGREFKRVAVQRASTPAQIPFKSFKSPIVSWIYGAPGEIRTPDLLIRSPFRAILREDAPGRNSLHNSLY